MLKIAICDDDISELNKTKSMCNSYIAKHSEIDLRVTTFSSAQELQKLITGNEKYDIAMLDIYMPDITGMELAKHIRDTNEDCQLIFLTTSLAHAVEAFALHAIHYLVKPYTQDQLEDALSQAVKVIEKQKKSYLMLKTSSGVMKIKYADLVYAETDKHLQLIYLADGRCVQIRMKSLELYELLVSDQRFYKCGSTYIVNMGKIEEVTKTDIIFDNGDRIPMQRRQYKELLDLYTAYSLEGN